MESGNAASVVDKLWQEFVWEASPPPEPRARQPSLRNVHGITDKDEPSQPSHSPLCVQQGTGISSPASTGSSLVEQRNGPVAPGLPRDLADPAPRLEQPSPAVGTQRRDLGLFSNAAKQQAKVRQQEAEEERRRQVQLAGEMKAKQAPAAPVAPTRVPAPAAAQSDCFVANQLPSVHVWPEPQQEFVRPPHAVIPIFEPQAVQPARSANYLHPSQCTPMQYQQQQQDQNYFSNQLQPQYTGYPEYQLEYYAQPQVQPQAAIRAPPPKPVVADRSRSSKPQRKPQAPAKAPKRSASATAKREWREVSQQETVQQWKSKVEQWKEDKRKETLEVKRQAKESNVSRVAIRRDNIRQHDPEPSESQLCWAASRPAPMMHYAQLLRSQEVVDWEHELLSGSDARPQVPSSVPSSLPSPALSLPLPPTQSMLVSPPLGQPSGQSVTPPARWLRELPRVHSPRAKHKQWLQQLETERKQAAELARRSRLQPAEAGRLQPQPAQAWQTDSSFRVSKAALPGPPAQQSRRERPAWMETADQHEFTNLVAEVGTLVQWIDSLDFETWCEDFDRSVVWNS
eukprot:TRINITY_DN4829_c0_g1_i1.p1 TRINITY_DN4829_c0_g1~~TRINITY_DN4829_c0_g1_i1.p1  ORF type:complete len:569 (-),score=83.52 TRINITY_DN4829_c0_g1_i1:44-1750(-)